MTVRSALHAYLDGELDLPSSLEIEQHLKACQECSRVYQGYRSLHSAMNSGTLYFEAPAELRKDPKSKLYSLHWFDCMGSQPEVFSGTFTGNCLTVAHGGPGMHARMTYDLADSKLMRTKMEMSQDGVAWKTLFEGRYERQ